MPEEAKRLVPFHLVDNTTFQYRPASSGRRMSSLASMKQASYTGNRPLSSEHPHSASSTARGSPPKQTSTSPGRPASNSNLMPFQPVKPPRQPSRPSSNRPGPFGIRGFNQQQSRLPSSEGQGSDGTRSNGTPVSGMVSVQGQASRGETPADYMRGHAKGAMSRGASKRFPEGEDSLGWSRINSTKSRFSARWDEESHLGMDARSATQPDKPAKVFRNAKLGGHTAGVGGHAAKLMDMGMEQQGALYKQPALGELVKVKAVSHGDRAVTVDQQKRRKPGQLISALHRDRLPGATFNKDKEGQARRVLAAAQNMYGPQPIKRKYVPRPLTPEGITLDGFLLLEAGNDELPEGVVVARLPSRNIQNVEVADMTYFTALKVLDLADNRIPDMTLLAPLLGIRALSLAMNRLGPVPMGGMLGDPGANAFQMLSTLDLSYNSLDASATLSPSSPLSHLPALCELNLSGNKWLTLPHTLGPFTALELLKLADNALMSSCLPALAALPSLKLLGLARNHMDGIMGVDGREGSLQEALALANLDVRTAFKSLQTLDLTRNKVRSEDAIKPLQLLPCLKSVILAGNPLAVKQVQAIKRAGEKRANAIARANSGAVPEPELLEQQQASSPLWVYEPVGQLGPKPSVGRVLTGNGGHFVAVQEPLGRQDATKAATLAAVTAAVPEEAVTEVFDRADAAIEVWQLNTVPEEEEGEDESEDDEPDGTFLTGVGITEKAPKAIPPMEDPEMPEHGQAPSEASSHSLWEDVSDPTERLALALGLDPSQLAIHTGIPTTDATGSVNALRHALAHPLVELGEGLGPAPRHLELTVAAKAKQRPRLQPIGQPGGATFVTAFGRTQAANPKRARTGAGMQEHPQIGPEASEQTSEAAQSTFPSDPRTVRVQHVEGMLTGMRSRLDALEGALANQLSKLPPGVTARAQRSMSRRLSRSVSRSPSRPCTPQAHSPGAFHAGSSATLHQKLQQQEQQQRPLSPFSASMSVDEDDDEADAEEQLLEPDSPGSNPSGTWPRQSGRPIQGVDPNDSDASSLPDDVVEAIENSDPSNSSGGESESNTDKRGSSRKELNDGLQRPPTLQQPSDGNQRYSPGAHKKIQPKDPGRTASPAK
uniref:Uncharacterized protein n=1 Tax=Dunaliella tertiolecta TaxID=3047 RepID=A0A7S3QSP4_DUNTE